MNSIDLQKKMIIQKSYDSMSMIRLRDILLVLATWGAWMYVIWYFYEYSSVLFTQNILVDWQMDDVFICLGGVCLTQLFCVHLRAAFVKRRLRRSLM